MLHHNPLHLYHLQRVQYLSDPDFIPRVSFCQCTQEQALANLRFADNILSYLQMKRGSHAMEFLIIVIHIYLVE